MRKPMYNGPGMRGHPREPWKKDHRSRPSSPERPLKKAVIPVQSSLGSYELVSQVGEGTYGKVYKAKTKDGFVALKRVRIETEKEGLPVTAIREIRLLTQLSHLNVVSLQELVSSVYEDGAMYIYMAFEYMDHDLTGLLNRLNKKLEPSQVKNLALQLFRGLEHLHSRGIMHRDLKASNLLLNAKGDLKLADLGLARHIFSSSRPKQEDYTNRVITLWYRPPELLLGSTKYDYSVDIWSAGSIILEMIDGKPIFTGKDEITQLERIWRILGTPNPRVHSELAQFPWWDMMKPRKEFSSTIREKYASHLTNLGFAFIESLMNYNPSARPSANAALEHEYFAESPLPCLNQDLPKLDGEWHEFESKLMKKNPIATNQERGPDDVSSQVPPLSAVATSAVTPWRESQAALEIPSRQRSRSPPSMHISRRQNSRNTPRARSRSRRRSRSRSRVRSRSRRRSRSPRPSRKSPSSPLPPPDKESYPMLSRVSLFGMHTAYFGSRR